MSVLNSVVDLQNQTAFNSLNSNSNDRNVGGVMGKHDFLMLLSAQLRHQDPLAPQSDSDFSAGLAQFSALEQMQNMNNTLNAMTEFQNFGLVGKYVLAEAMIGGQMRQIIGPVDSVFTLDGVMFASVNGYDIPLSSIREVFNGNSLVTPDMLHNASNNLIGRIVIAEVDGETIEGLVTRVLFDDGMLMAQIRVSEGVYRFVPVNTIVDIRMQDIDMFTPIPPPPAPPVDCDCECEEDTEEVTPGTPETETPVDGCEEDTGKVTPNPTEPEPPVDGGGEDTGEVTPGTPETEPPADGGDDS